MRSLIVRISFLVLTVAFLLPAPAARADGFMEDGIVLDTGSYTYACVNWSTCQDIVEPKIYGLEGVRMCATVYYNASCECHDTSSPTTEGYCIRLW